MKSIRILRRLFQDTRAGRPCDYMPELVMKICNQAVSLDRRLFLTHARTHARVRHQDFLSQTPGVSVYQFCSCFNFSLTLASVLSSNNCCVCQFYCNFWHAVIIFCIILYFLISL